MRDQRAHDDAAGDRRLERFFELRAVEAEDDDVDGFLGLADGLEERREPVVGLDDQFHVVPVPYFDFFLSAQSTAAWPSGSSLSSGIGDAVGLHVERHPHIVRDFLVRRRANLVSAAVAAQDRFDLRALFVGLVADLHLEQELLAALRLERLDDRQGARRGRPSRRRCKA